ncbi:MAG: biotin--[acetyl-CoA-carboxylase] ligase [Marinirhabdus sp.]|nr:biotin--[acetyl-CoA-carboxylase] ligase [Marinirhabdus sp.]
MKVIKLNAIDSTNSYLKELISSVDLNDKVAVIANEQLKGQGQRGATWSSEAGKSLTCSLFKRLSGLAIQEQSALTFLVSLSLLKVLRKYNVPDVSVKWPNDIMSRQKKLAGILIENQVKGNAVTSSVIGIGLNVNESEMGELAHATSIRIVTGQEHDIEQLFEAIATTIFDDLEANSALSIAALQRKYESELFRKDKISTFAINGTHRNGKILGVTRQGLLRVEHESGETHYDLKEIRLLF